MNSNRRAFPPPTPLPPKFPHTLTSAPLGYRPAGISVPQQHSRLHAPPQPNHTYQPVFVIPISAASNPVDPLAVDLSTNTRPFSVPAIAPRPENPVPSSSTVARGKRSIPPIDDREMRRRVKKQNMERRRRACISDKLTALHSLAVSLIGEKPQQQTNQRTEITDMLNQCVNVLKGISEFVKSEPELQAKMHRLRIKPSSVSEDQKRRKRPNQNEPSTSTERFEQDENKENYPRVSAFTPVMGRLNPLSVPSPLGQKCVTPTHGRKRGSVDSGLDVCLTSPSFSSSNPSDSSSSFAIPSTPPLKRPRNPEASKIWRPYED
nr:STARP-like antigen [Hymenolepis microstoma]CUU99879.1 STARP-like antigen [Hymenolepis microstoma]